jgi:hypothetical protein
MRGRAVEIKIIFFDVFSVVALAISETEEAFLEDRILPVPKRECKTELLVLVRQTGKAVLSPPIGP